MTARSVGQARPGRFVRPIALASSFAVLVFSPAVASADIANGLAEFLNGFTLFFTQSNFPTADFSTVIGGTSGSGFLWSLTTHGPFQQKDFPTSAAYIESTASEGDTENSRNAVNYAVSGGASSFIRLGGARVVNSDSQAASSGGIRHEAASYATTSVYQILTVSRNAGAGTVNSPIFGVDALAQAQAIHLKASKEGNADAKASVFVSLVGRIRNLNLPTTPFENLDELILTGDSITANGEWYSPEVDKTVHLNLPDWTRIRGANFELDLGLHLQMFTQAEVVPEPASLAIVGMGLAAWVVRRRKRKGC